MNFSLISSIGSWVSRSFWPSIPSYLLSRPSRSRILLSLRSSCRECFKNIRPVTGSTVFLWKSSTSWMNDPRGILSVGRILPTEGRSPKLLIFFIVLATFLYTGVSSRDYHRLYILPAGLRNLVMSYVLRKSMSFFETDRINFFRI